MNLKRAFLLLVAVLLVLFSFLNSAGLPAQDQDRDIDESEADAEKMIDRAGYCYGILEDYPRALKYLKRAVELAGDPSVKSTALVKTAYVFFLMGERVSLYKKYILKTLELTPKLELERLYYKTRFIKIFNSLKKDPLLDDEAILAVVNEPEPGERSPGARFFVKAQLDYMGANDSGYRDVYGSGYLFPRVKAGFKLARNVYLFSGFGVVSSKGTIPGAQEDASSIQRFLSLGLSYTGTISKRLGYTFEASAVGISFREEALGVEVKESTMGFDVETGVVFNLGKRLFSEFSAGYLYGSDVLSDRKVLLGGFKTGLGFGVRF